MCCDSTLFYDGPLQPEEVAPAIASGFAVERVEDADRFIQPCTQLAGTTCTAYGRWRPHVCGKFRCRQLDILKSDEATLDDAQATVRRARALLSRLPDDLRTLRAMRAFAKVAEDEMVAGNLSPERARLMMDAIVAIRFLDEQFRAENKRVLSP